MNQIAELTEQPLEQVDVSDPMLFKRMPFDLSLRGSGGKRRFIIVPTVPLGLIGR